MTMRLRVSAASLILGLGLVGCGNEPVPEVAPGSTGKPAPAGDHPLPTPHAREGDVIVPSPVPKLPDPGPGPGMSKEGELVKPTGEVQPTTPAPVAPQQPDAKGDIPKN